MNNSTERTPLISGSGHESESAVPGAAAANNAYLSRFQQAIGINAINSSHVDLESSRRGASGIYKEVISAQKWRQFQYQVVQAIYYLAILANLVIGATLASLGPLSKLHPTSITVLGIVNTSTAGILALLKGQGLPDRLRKDEFEMRKVQDFIEEMEARLAFMTEEMSEKELDDLVKDIFNRYNIARDTAEMNRPESYVHQVDSRPPGDGSEEQQANDERQQVLPASGAHQTTLALSSGKGKALVMS